MIFLDDCGRPALPVHRLPGRCAAFLAFFIQKTRIQITMPERITSTANSDSRQAPGGLGRGDVPSPFFEEKYALLAETHCEKISRMLHEAAIGVVVRDDVRTSCPGLVPSGARAEGGDTW